MDALHVFLLCFEMFCHRCVREKQRSVYRMDLFAWATVTKYHSLGVLNNRNSFFSQFWRLQVEVQGIGMFVFFPGDSVLGL